MVPSDAADKDSRISVSGFSYKDTHKNWYNELYKNATTKARGRLEDYATMVMEKYAAEFKKLDDDVQEQIEKLKTSASFREEVCPMAERKGW